jgi:hypothetical protein
MGILVLELVDEKMTPDLLYGLHLQKEPRAGRKRSLSTGGHGSFSRAERSLRNLERRATARKRFSRPETFEGRP